MTSNQRNWVVFFSAAAATSLGSATYFSVTGTNDESILIVLRLSARIAFVILLVIFVARPLQQMFRTPFTAKLLRNRRLLGIAFAGIHTAHLGLIFYRVHMNETFSVTPANRPLGALVYLMIFLMFATSFDKTARMLGPKRWRILHKTGLYSIFAAFAITQLRKAPDNLEVSHWAFLVLIAAALIVRLTAYLAQQQRRAST